VVSLAVLWNENTTSSALYIGASAQTDRLQKPQVNDGSRLCMFSLSMAHRRKNVI